MQYPPQDFSAAELRRLRPFQHAPEALLKALAEQVAPQWAARGTRIVARGSDEDVTYFLLDGTVRLVAVDGTQSLVTAGQEAASRPLSHLRPRRHDVISETTVRYLRVENPLLATLAASFADPLTQAITADGSGAVSLAALQAELAKDLQLALDRDQLTLPSLPDIAVRVGRAVLDEKSNSKRIAALVQTDPVISAKLVRAANSAFFGGHRRVDSLTGAITQLGFELTHKLVLSFALREIFNASSRAARERMRELWRHSTQVGALCQTLATNDRRFDPQQALLAGLVHDIGSVAVVSHLAQRARFPEELVACAVEGEQWERDPAPEPDYCDVVVVAQLLAFLGSSTQLDGLPPLSAVPAFGKLRLSGADPESTDGFLDRAREQVAHTQALLTS